MQPFIPLCLPDRLIDSRYDPLDHMQGGLHGGSILVRVGVVEDLPKEEWVAGDPLQWNEEERGEVEAADFIVGFADGLP